MVSEFCGVLSNGFAVRFEHVFHIFKSGFQHRDEEVDVVMRRVSMALRFSFTRAKILKTAHDPVRAFVVGSISPCVGHSFHYCRPVSSTSTAAAIVHLPTEDHPSRKPECRVQTHRGPMVPAKSRPTSSHTRRQPPASQRGDVCGITSVLYTIKSSSHDDVSPIGEFLMMIDPRIAAAIVTASGGVIET